jgi:hypothetical protein
MAVWAYELSYGRSSWRVLRERPLPQPLPQGRASIRLLGTFDDEAAAAPVLEDVSSFGDGAFEADPES